MKSAIVKNKYLILLITSIGVYMGYFYKSAREIIYDYASSFMGVQEVPGESAEQSNPIIDKFLNVFGLSNDEVAWCSCFVGYVMDMNGYDISDQTPMARSWDTFGHETTEPKRGDIVVFWRESPLSGWGHVGFLDRIEGDKIFVLGGNQSNRVKISWYPKHRLVSYRKY